MAQPRRDDQHLGAANRIMNSLHAKDVSNANVIIAGNELSFLQQIQGGQQIMKRPLHQLFEDPTRSYGKSTCQSSMDILRVLRTLIIKHSNLWFISV